MALCRGELKGVLCRHNQDRVSSSTTVELQRTRVLKAKRVGDVILPEEVEQTDVTAVGEVKQRMNWRHK